MVIIDQLFRWLHLLFPSCVLYPNSVENSRITRPIFNVIWSVWKAVERHCLTWSVGYHRSEWCVMRCELWMHIAHHARYWQDDQTGVSIRTMMKTRKLTTTFQLFSQHSKPFCKIVEWDGKLYLQHLAKFWDHACFGRVFWLAFVDIRSTFP